MALPYDAHEIEGRWQRRWDEEHLYEVDVDAASHPDVFYNLVEFPYPSADGLHVGHVFKYCGADALGRLRRMQGRTVFQPIGFDSFGINAENFALRTGQHPRQLIERTIRNFTRQLSSIGCGWDWTHSVATSDPSYYRWTQWLFVRLFQAGLAYQAEAPVTWCPSCQTVLAREQTEGDRCERCVTVVVERVMRQWFARITKYADRLLDGMEALDWPERSRRIQRDWIGRGKSGYRLHDWLLSRQRYWGPPIPIVHCDRCGSVPVPEDQLPVLLPDIDDIRPPGDGRSPLAACEEWVHTTCPSCGEAARRETDVLDTFFDSSWYFLRYPSTDIADEPWSVDRTKRMFPVDFYAGGPEHVARHHLYARFVTMALHDLGLVPFDEPFPHVRLGGIVTKDGARMSKSKGNVVDPDTYIAEHGADVLRVFLLFSGPWDHGGDFRDDGIVGIERFFGRVWRRVHESPDGRSRPDVAAGVTEAIDSLRFNVGIAALMGAVRDIDATELVLLLAPFAPYLAEELWSALGGSGSVHTHPWPLSST